MGLRRQAKSNESCLWKTGRLFSLEKFEKRTRQDEAYFTMAMGVLAHRLKSVSFYRPIVELMQQ